MAMFAAMALGAPLGMPFTPRRLWHRRIGHRLPLATFAVSIRPSRHSAIAVLQGLPSGAASQCRLAARFGAALSSVGYGAILAFGSLLLYEGGWSPVWLPFTAFAASLVAAASLFGHLPDRLGGAKVAFGSVIIEALGLALLWLAPGPITAAVGAALTGFGYALVYPGLGVEAVGRAPPQSRGLAMGAYTVFLDVAIGFGGPRSALSLRRTASVRLFSSRPSWCSAPRGLPCGSWRHPIRATRTPDPVADGSRS